MKAESPSSLFPSPRLRPTSVVRLLRGAAIAASIAAAIPAGAADRNTRAEGDAPAARSWLRELYPHGMRARDVIGTPVVGRSGETLGRIDDLVVDTTSGRIIYAIVGSGGFVGLGETRHAVPFSALSGGDSNGNPLRLDISSADWTKAPVFNSDQLAALGDPARSEYIFRHYGQTWQPLGGENPVRTDQVAPGDSGLRLATSLFDREVRAGGQTIGRAEDLVVNVPQKSASVLFDPNDTFSGDSQRYVVPFDRLNARTADRDTLAAELSRSDFESARSLTDRTENSANDAIYRWEVKSRR